MKKLLAVVIILFSSLSLVGAAQAATPGQRNALHTARDYLDGQAFSKSGLVHQLVFEKFSRSDARWAVNHVRVSWKGQAVRMAKGYLDGQSFSRDGLVHQLEFEGFTSSQAEYGVSKAYR